MDTNAGGITPGAARIADVGWEGLIPDPLIDLGDKF
jgi:hypothetical protein